MVIISRPVLKEFIARHALSTNAINEWYAKTKSSDWSRFSDVKKNWNSCDSIGNDRFVFDIGGNKYRLIAMIHFSRRTLYIRAVLTHEEYAEIGKRGKLAEL